jgi:hypothetical protein
VANENRGRNFLIGFILGAVIGSVVTGWLAGRVQRQLRRRGIDLGTASELASSARERGSNWLARVREIVRQAMEEGRQAADRTRSDIEEKYKRQS